jgi:hypothetical protein
MARHRVQEQGSTVTIEVTEVAGGVTLVGPLLARHGKLARSTQNLRGDAFCLLDQRQ